MSTMIEYTTSDLPENVSTSGEPVSEFSKLLRKKWQRCRMNGILRYDVKDLPTKIVQGTNYNYVLQLNPDRGVKRRAPVHIDSLRQPFNRDGFHFGRVDEKEVLLRIRNDQLDDTAHSILINVSPISPYHSLLCPSLERGLPQTLTRDSLRTALEVYFLANDPHLRIVFNGLCALASVNHLHYHLLFEQNVMPAEVVTCKHIIGMLYRTEECYPVPAYCFQLKNKSDIERISEDAFKLVDLFVERNIAHNMAVMRGLDLKGNGENVVRILFWPRRNSFGAKQADAFNIASCELSGWFPIYDQRQFDNLQATDLEDVLNEWKIDDFDVLDNHVRKLYTFQ